MARKRKVIRPQNRKANSVDLDHVPGTSSTEQFDSNSSRRDPSYKRSESVPPPFEGEKNGSFVSWSEINLTWKVAAVIGTIFIGVGAPIIWFSSNMNNELENMGVEMNGIKEKTEKIFVMSIRNEERLNNTEKSIERIEKSIHSIAQEKPNKKVNKDASR